MGDDPLVLRVQNLRALREVSWSPSGVCALVGGNGSGKTTLLLVLKLLRAAIDQDLVQAVTNVFGGSLGLAHRDREDEPITVGLDVGDLSWSVRLIPSDGSCTLLLKLHLPAITDFPGLKCRSRTSTTSLNEALLTDFGCSNLLTTFDVSSS